MKLAPIAVASLLLASSPLAALAQPAPGPMPLFAEPREPRPVRRSNGMMIAGIVLTSIASSLLVAGVTTTIALAGSNGPLGDTRGALIAGLPILGASLLFAGVGIPLWVVGASPAQPRTAQGLPTVTLGAGSATLLWAF